MLNLRNLSGLAILVIAQLLMLSAWLTTSEPAWFYYLWTALIILAWSQPWTRSDPYRTISPRARFWIYVALAGGAFVSWVIFGSNVPLLIIIEVIILYLLEYTGQRAIKRS